MLVALVLRHRGHLAADLRRFYGVRLSEVREHMGLMELVDCVAHLPPDAAVWRALDPDASITIDHHLLRVIEFQLRRLVWMQTKDAQSPYPSRQPERLVPLTADELAEFAEEERKNQPILPDALSLDELRVRLPME